MATNTNIYNMPSPNTPEKLQDILRESSIPRVFTASRIRTPSVVILLGSTPARAALEVMRQMLTLSGKDRRKTAFVYIDTDDIPHDLIEFRESHKGLFQEFITRIAVPAHIETSYIENPAIRRHTFIQPFTPQFFTTGAGGIRNNGHVALAYNLFEVHETIENAINQVMLINESDRGNIHSEIQVSIVSFLGGGTGSGILGDISVMIREILVNRDLTHRLNLYCVLPEYIQGSSSYEISWRRSNAEAALLELIALEVATSKSTTRSFKKYMLGEYIDVLEHYTANEVYLYGHTGMKEFNDVARVVGIDLFQRITDASGVGLWERSKWVDRRSLSAKDQKGLPTFFSQSCALEICFDAYDMAKCFAKMTSAYLLPSLVGQEPPPPDTQNKEDNWKRELTSIIEFGEGAGEISSTPEPTIDDLTGIQDWGYFEQDLNEKITITQKRVQNMVELKQKQEMEMIYGKTPFYEEDKIYTPIQKRIRHLSRLIDKYKVWERWLRDNPAPEVGDFPQERIENYNTPVKWLPNGLPVQEWLRPARAAQLQNAIKNYIYDQDERNKSQALQKLTETLKGLTEKVIQEEKKWFRAADVSELSSKLIAEARNSMAWRGFLELRHPHRRHVFDLPEFRHYNQKYEANIAVENLYWQLTFRNENPVNASQTEIANIQKRVADLFLHSCMTFLSSNAREDAEFDDNDLSGIGDHGKEFISNQVVEYFTDYYLNHAFGKENQNAYGLLKLNLIELLQYGSGKQTKREISDFLYAHLTDLRTILRKYLSFEPGLEATGYSQVDTSLYLGMRWEDGGREKEILDMALLQLGPMTEGDEAGKTPVKINLIDPHRLQILYGIHGISITTINDLCMPRGSMMADYLTHEDRWFGSVGQGYILSTPQRGYYGVNGMPVHSSSEMERLVCRQNLLFAQQNIDGDSSLRGQVLRHISPIDSEPGGWNTNPEDEGFAPGNGPDHGPNRQNQNNFNAGFRNQGNNNQGPNFRNQ